MVLASGQLPPLSSYLVKYESYSPSAAAENSEYSKPLRYLEHGLGSSLDPPTAAAALLQESLPGTPTALLVPTPPLKSTSPSAKHYLSPSPAASVHENL